MMANLIATPIGVTVSFLGYKWFVFKTKGNYIREWLRCVAVYSSTFVLSMVSLPALVYCIHRLGGAGKTAPYIAGAIVSLGTAVVSFFGHKHISFGGGQAGGHAMMPRQV